MAIEDSISDFIANLSLTPAQQAANEKNKSAISTLTAMLKPAAAGLPFPFGLLAGVLIKAIVTMFVMQADAIKFMIQTLTELTGSRDALIKAIMENSKDPTGAHEHDMENAASDFIHIGHKK